MTVYTVCDGRELPMNSESHNLHMCIYYIIFHIENYYIKKFYFKFSWKIVKITEFPASKVEEIIIVLDSTPRGRAETQSN